MKQLHKHYDLILAWAAGAKIQCKTGNNTWVDCFRSPEWDINTEYRIKPEPEKYAAVYLKGAYPNALKFKGPDYLAQFVASEHHLCYINGVEAVIQEFCKRNNLNRSEMK